MGDTFVEKVLARSVGLSSLDAGQVVDVFPDRVLSHDNTAAIIDIWRQLGQERVLRPEQLVIVLDHAVPAPTTVHAENHRRIREFAAVQGIEHFFDVGRGICHQVLSEEGLVQPGMVILGADSHTTHYGALGAFGAGIGRSEVAAIWATGSVWLRVPESIKIVVTGALPEWVSAKDLGLHIIGQLGADGGNYYSVELHGPAISALSMESRFVLPNLMAEMGVKNAWIPPDAVTRAWLRNRGTDWDDGAICLPDVDASYAAVHTLDASFLEPQIARPHTVDNVVPLSEVEGVPVDQAFLGTCTNGRLEDLEIAARVLRGRRVNPRTRLLVIPASSEVLRQAMASGALQTLLDAGAMLGTPGCGPCMGNHLGVPAPGEVTVSSANRNFRGRMGTRDADIYLASPAVVAASAAAGCLAHPAKL
jgi:3-isopropylmalate/(R)-2-methylmalate dehydratase large subunit